VNPLGSVVVKGKTVEVRIFELLGIEQAQPGNNGAAQQAADRGVSGAHTGH
jgi:hypothetical protein